ncbi:hypothetical protein [Verrucomicrobium spinosum]|uniref:hypothetical protein n=1 Tax=Verrucomicrobium spinosum TaxID=2736 RepID=UPI000ADB87C2|nr:hypothetical protein [Verrucomicrobium spinosum]
MAETRDIPDYPLTDYVQPEIAELGLYVGRFEVLNTQMDRPPGMHRHGHFELFWLHGPAEHFNDFEHFKLPAEHPSFILVSPGQLHRWEGADDIRGTLISFTTAFFDGREPPPSRLMQLGFVNRMCYPPVLTADTTLEEDVTPLIARCEQEYATRGEGWMEVCRHSIRLILLLASRAWLRQKPEPGRQDAHGNCYNASRPRWRTASASRCRWLLRQAAGCDSRAFERCGKAVHCWHRR